MKKKLAVLFALIVWFAVIAQYYIMVKNSSLSVVETTVRFLSYFTILTNLLVAFYFTFLQSSNNRRYDKIGRPGTLTALTTYITVVGLSYQVLLRHIWQPTGLQMIVDELLHTVIPILVIVFWYLYENKRSVKYASILGWAIYPLVYLAFILVLGNASSFYPYYFVDVTAIGLQKTLINSGFLLLLFIVVAGLFIFIGKRLPQRR